MAELPDKLYQSEQVRELDRLSIERLEIPSYKLMQRAAEAAFKCVQKILTTVRTTSAAPRILIACGGGNNGGDGYAIAHLCLLAGMRVDVLALVPEPELRLDALTAARVWRNCGGQTLILEQTQIGEYDLIVDAVLGIGLQREVEGLFYECIEQINASKAYVLAIDVPSGLNADTGTAMGIAVKARQTITFIGLKQGLLTGEAANYCGNIVYDDLGVPASVFDSQPSTARLIRQADLQACLPVRRRDAHKGHFGHVLIIGGEHGMSGAVQMAAIAALRTGAGLVSVATRAEHAALLNIRQPELMCHGVEKPAELEPLLRKATVIVIGPGLGRSVWANSLLAKVLESALPLVVDADALHLIATDRFKRDHWVLTPHPGEAAALLHSKKRQIQTDRYTAVRLMVEQYNATAVLKGAGTLVASDSECAVCNRGSAAMASGGMGDLLSGIIAALIAQGLSCYEAACCGVYIHACAGELAAEQGERGTVATDLLSYIRLLANPEYED